MKFNKKELDLIYYGLTEYEDAIERWEDSSPKERYTLKRIIKLKEKIQRGSLL